MTILNIVVVIITLSACGASKGNASAKDSGEKTPESAILLQATKQTTLPGRPEIPPTTEYNFVIVWESTETPSEIFWRGESDWISCSAVKVSNYSKMDTQNPSMEKNYTIGEEVTKFSKNDTLEITPLTPSINEIPESIPKHMDNNTLYFKLNDNKWHTIEVKNVIEMPDIIMP